MLITSLDLIRSRPSFFYESSQLVIQIQLRYSVAFSQLLTDLLLHIKLQHTSYLCLTFSFRLCPIQFQASVDVKYRAAILVEFLPVDLRNVTLNQFAVQYSHVQTWTHCSRVHLIFWNSGTTRRCWLVSDLRDSNWMSVEELLWRFGSSHVVVAVVVQLTRTDQLNCSPQSLVSTRLVTSLHVNDKTVSLNQTVFRTGEDYGPREDSLKESAWLRLQHRLQWWSKE